MSRAREGVGTDCHAALGVEHPREAGDKARCAPDSATPPDGQSRSSGDQPGREDGLGRATRGGLGKEDKNRVALA